MKPPLNGRVLCLCELHPKLYSVPLERVTVWTQSQIDVDWMERTVSLARGTQRLRAGWNLPEATLCSSFLLS